jgi:hypothetical protein
VATVASAFLAVASGLAGADSFTPITMTAKNTPVARRHAPLAIRVSVQADAGVLDTSDQPLRVQVKLASECGGSFQTTSGTTLLNAPLKPTPQTGRAYSGGAQGSGKPSAYGLQRVCMYLEDPTADRVYANDETNQVDVTVRCTAAGSRYDSAHRALLRAQRQLRRAHTAAAKARARRLVTSRRRTLAKDRRAGIAACGKGVPL